MNQSSSHSATPRASKKRRGALKRSVVILLLSALAFIITHQVRLPILEAQLREVRQADLTTYVSSLKSYLDKHRSIAVLLAKSLPISEMVSEQAIITDDVADGQTTLFSGRLRRTAVLSRAETVDVVRFSSDEFSWVAVSDVGSASLSLRAFDEALRTAKQGRLGRQLRYQDGQARYVFAAPVSNDVGVIGAVLYAVDMSVLQEQWTSSPNIIDVYNQNNQIFMNNRESVVSLLNTGQLIEAIAVRDNYRSIETVDTELDWRIVLYFDDHDEQIQALISAAFAALLMAVAAMLVAFFFYRRQKLVEQLAWQDEQAHLLEQKVEERTIALAEANEQLTSMQAELVRSEKMSLLGRVSASISHEISQPLSAMDVSIRNIQQFIATDNIEGARISLKRIDKLNYRMIRIIQNLRAFARNEPTSTKVVNINALCNEAVNEFLQSESDAKSALQIVALESDIQALAGEVRLMQVIVNVLQNAWRAVKDVDSPRIALQISASGALVWIDIRDNGLGVPDNLKKDIFEAFVTTRDGDGSGTGLGLSVAQSFISSMDGALSLVTEPLPEDEASWLASSLADETNQSPLSGAHFRIQLIRATFENQPT